MDEDDSEAMKVRKTMRCRPSPLVALLLLSVGLNCIGAWTMSSQGPSKDQQLTYCKCSMRIDDADISRR